MRASIVSSGTDHATAAASAFIASLIESAVDSLEVDRNRSREQLLHASALLRAQARSAENCIRSPGRLATWQTRCVTEYIERNLEFALDATELAGMINLSASHFFRAFKATVGLPPRKYITQRRIALAIKLMSTTDQSLAQIALACGLCDQSHLCRIFIRAVGVPPGVWRRAYGTGPEPRRSDGPNNDVFVEHVVQAGGRSACSD